MEQRAGAGAACVFMVVVSACASGAHPPRAPVAPVSTQPARSSLPALLHRARLSATGGATLLGFDASADGAVAVVRHQGPLVVDGRELAADGAAISVVRFDADGELAWTKTLSGGELEIASVRVGADGSVALGGTADSSLSCDGKRVCRLASGRGGVMIFLRDGEYDGSGGWVFYDMGGGVAAILPRPADGGRVRWAGWYDVATARANGYKVGPDPYQAGIGDVSGMRQRFGSDQPIDWRWIEPGPDGLVLLLGSFAGTLAGGGKPAIQSERRDVFFTVLDSDGHMSAPVALPLPDDALAMSPVLARIERTQVDVLALAETKTGVAPWFYAFDGRGQWIAACPLALDDPGATIRGLDVAPGMIVVAGHIGGAEVAAFFDQTCAPGAQLSAPPGRELHGVRLVGAELVAALTGDGEVELDWFALPRG